MCGTTFMNHLCTPEARCKECYVHWNSSRGAVYGVKSSTWNNTPSDARRLEQRPTTVTLRCIFVGQVAWKERDSYIVFRQTHYIRAAMIQGLKSDCNTYSVCAFTTERLTRDAADCTQVTRVIVDIMSVSYTHLTLPTKRIV